ncbi:MAG: hypothetical protein HPY44_09065 [Armatimonadetes bacterium]|nr:hypothetical protein [Armatimonadota bacterium]
MTASSCGPVVLMLSLALCIGGCARTPPPTEPPPVPPQTRLPSEPGNAAGPAESTDEDPEKSEELALGYAARARESLLASKYDEAIALADKAIELRSDLAEAYLVRGEALGYRAGEKSFEDSSDPDAGPEKKRALADIETAIELAPDLAPAFVARGLWRLDAGQVQEAISDFTRAIEIDPKYGEAYYHRAIASEDVDPEQSRLDSRKAEELGYNPGP